MAAPGGQPLPPALLPVVAGAVSGHAHVAGAPSVLGPPHGVLPVHGQPGQGGGGSVLEEYLDSLPVMPVEVRRYTTLMRELDGRAAQNLSEMREMQDRFVERAAALVAGSAAAQARTPAGEAERARLVAELRAHADFASLEKVRASLKQKVAEKRSVSEQLFDISETNLQRLRGDVAQLEALFRGSGEFPEAKFNKGMEVAAWMEKDAVWILCIVAEYSPQTPDVVTVADFEDATAKYQLPASKVMVLPTGESLAAAKSRLSSRGRKVLAIYPETTSFYKAALSSTPFKESGTNPALQVNPNLFANFPAGTILCGVHFDDDVDPVTGQTLKHFVPCKWVVIPASSHGAF